MQWEVMPKSDAKEITGSWQNMPKSSFDSMIFDWEQAILQKLNDEYRELRKQIKEAQQRAVTEVEADPLLKAKREYFTDLKFGIYLYQVLEKNGFSVRLASNDQIWIYFSVAVVPDIVHARYPGTKVKTENGIVFRNVNEDRFWQVRRRIYLKVLWWYIYLSMQVDADGNNDFEKTFEILKDNSTDEIVQLVERAGRYGYRIDVYRELMRFYSENRDKYNNKTFRQVMVLNTARTQVIEPFLMTGGIKTYVRELFEYFESR